MDAAQVRLLGIRARDEMCSIDAGSLDAQACKIDRRELLRLLDESRAQSGWRPIETAPKDGSNVLVWGPHGHEHLVVSYDDTPEHPGYPWLTLDGPQYPEKAFSHWMPLPEPPDVKEH